MYVCVCHIREHRVRVSCWCSKGPGLDETVVARYSFQLGAWMWDVLPSNAVSVTTPGGSKPPDAALHCKKGTLLGLSLPPVQAAR